MFGGGDLEVFPESPEGEGLIGDEISEFGD